MARTAAALLLAALAALAETPRTAARAERDAAVWPNRWTGSNRHGAYRPVWDAEKATWPDVRRTKDDRGLQGVCLGARHAAAFRQCSSTHVFVGVLSAAANAERRAAVRQTWASAASRGDDARRRGRAGKPRVDVRFFVMVDKAHAESLRREAKQHGDVVLLHWQRESYFGIANKTLAILEYGATWPGATHVFKTDDDTYVDLPRLVRSVLRCGDVGRRSSKAHAPGEYLIGYLEPPGGTPKRGSDAWDIPYEDVPDDRLPAWPHGALYGVTVAVARSIAADKDVRTAMKLEDIGAAMWIKAAAERLPGGVELCHDPAFNFKGCDEDRAALRPTATSSSGARQSRDLAAHWVGPCLMFCMHETRRCCPEYLARVKGECTMHSWDATALRWRARTPASTWAEQGVEGAEYIQRADV